MIRSALKALSRFHRREDGAAAAEMAIWAAALIPIVFGIVDLANFAFKKMQVNEAAQAAAQRAWLLCNTNATLPVKNCTGLLEAMKGAAQATGLGTAVTVSATSDGYYCANSFSALVLVGTAGNLATLPTKPSPFTCNSVTTGSTAAPGEYVLVTTTYTFAPAFGGISFSALLPTTVTRTAWLRLA